MQDNKNLSKIKIQDQKIIDNKELNIWEALFPVIILVAMLAYNVYVFGDDALSGSNQFILLIGGAVAAFVGFRNKVSYKRMIEEVAENIKSTAGAILILLMVGALAGTWLISGIIPAMIYYGLQILSPSIFLPATVVIAALISIATGSSWTTSATVGIALIGIGKAIGIPPGMIAGAVVSGAYFGDKMSPLSDTTNLAPAMAGTDIFTHIKYMMYTTFPSIFITLIVFIILSFTIETSGTADVSNLLTSLKSHFNVTPYLFIVPAVVVSLIVFKTKPIVALIVGILLASVFAVIFQADVVANITGATKLDLTSSLKGIATAIWADVSIATDNEVLNELFTSSGTLGMLWTILLIMSALVFGGIMEAIGALSRISAALLSVADSVFGLFASTVVSCLAINVTASDQYLAIVVPGKMFAKAYKDKGLAPENLSRTLEDTGTVTSALIPWNTCGAYQASVLGVSVESYFIYAVFNYVSPFMTLLFAAFEIKIKRLDKPTEQ